MPRPSRTPAPHHCHLLQHIGCLGDVALSFLQPSQLAGEPRPLNLHKDLQSSQQGALCLCLPLLEAQTDAAATSTPQAHIDAAEHLSSLNDISAMPSTQRCSRGRKAAASVLVWSSSLEASCPQHRVVQA